MKYSREEDWRADFGAPQLRSVEVAKSLKQRSAPCAIKALFHYAGPCIYFSILTFLILFINDEKLES